jgi:hypothetical protein
VPQNVPPAWPMTVTVNSSGYFAMSFSSFSARTLTLL